MAGRGKKRLLAYTTPISSRACLLVLARTPRARRRLQIRQLPDPLADRTLQIPVSPARALRLEEQCGAISQLTPQVVDGVASLKRDRHRGWAAFGITGSLDSPALEPKRSEISSNTTAVQAAALIRLATARTSGLTRCHCFPPTLIILPPTASCELRTLLQAVLYGLGSPGPATYAMPIRTISQRLVPQPRARSHGRTGDKQPEGPTAVSSDQASHLLLPGSGGGI